ncbi:HPP family protein [Chloroflexota bacterium]
MLVFVKVITDTAVIAALGASAFIVFAMPNTDAASPRKLVGGNIVGLLCGTSCYFLFLTGPVASAIPAWEHTLWVVSAFVIGFSIFLMTITNTEHPPAASIALGMVIGRWSYEVFLFVLVYSVCLAVIKFGLKRFLIDLF